MVTRAEATGFNGAVDSADQVMPEGLIDVSSHPVGVTAPARRSPNRLWLVTGLLIVLITGVLSFVLFSTTTDRVSVLAAGRSIEVGERLDRSNVVVVDVLPGTAATAIRLDQYLEDPDLVLGQEVQHRVESGAIIQPASLFAEQVEDEPMILGARLAPGQYPLPQLTSGDRVAVIILETLDDDSFSVRAEQFTEAVVVDISSLGSGANSEVFVSFEVGSSEAAVISGALAQSRVRLGLVEYES
ncbi:MAG: SAF domain-containing protein [Actinomycetota bacterium]